MPRHQILLRLSRKFPVVWIDKPRPWREQIAGVAEAKLDSRDLSLADAENFILYQPGRFLGTFYKPTWLRDAIRRRRIRNAISMLRAKGCSRIVLYTWRPEFAYALDAAPWERTIYHIDDEYSFADHESPITDEERSLITKSDHVIIHSTSLMERKGQLNSNSSLVPNGVDYASYTRPTAEPVDLQNIPHPRIAYIGVIKQQLDFSVLQSLAEQHPDKSLIMVGPVNAHHDIKDAVANLEALPNVFFLGNKSPHELPAYTQHIDMGLLPYRVNHYTNSIYPLKLHEYLATGIPVLATPIRTAKNFSSDVEIASSPADWAEAVQRCLSDAELAPAKVAARQAIAARHDWDAISDQIAEIIQAS